MGGITAALQMADAAYGYELPITLASSPGNIDAHLGSAMPYFKNLEITDPVPPESFLSTDVHIEDGWAIAGDKPGNGLEIDHDALAKTKVDAIPPDAAAVPVGRRRGAGLYEVLPTKEELESATKGLRN